MWDIPPIIFSGVKDIPPKFSYKVREGTDMLPKYVTDMVIPLVGLLKCVTDFQGITSGEIVKNVKCVTMSLCLIVC